MLLAGAQPQTLEDCGVTGEADRESGKNEVKLTVKAN